MLADSFTSARNSRTITIIYPRKSVKERGSFSQEAAGCEFLFFLISLYCLRERVITFLCSA